MSGRKNTLLPISVITNGVMTGTTAIASPSTNVQYLDNISYRAKWTGTPTGTMVVQGSHTGGTADTEWDTIISASAAPTGADGTQLFDLNQLSFPYTRLLYTNASGVGVLNVTVTGKAV